MGPTWLTWETLRWRNKCVTLGNVLEGTKTRRYIAPPHASILFAWSAQQRNKHEDPLLVYLKQERKSLSVAYLVTLIWSMMPFGFWVCFKWVFSTKATWLPSVSSALLHKKLLPFVAKSHFYSSRCRTTNHGKPLESTSQEEKGGKKKQGRAVGCRRQCFVTMATTCPYDPGTQVRKVNWLFAEWNPVANCG